VSSSDQQLLHRPDITFIEELGMSQMKLQYMEASHFGIKLTLAMPGALTFFAVLFYSLCSVVFDVH
jgi:hypothetical protein